MKNNKHNKYQVVRKPLAVILIFVLMVGLTGCGGGGNKSELAEVKAELEIAKTNWLNAMAEADSYKDKYESLNGIVSMYPEIAEAADFGSNVILKDGTRAKLNLNGQINIGKKYNGQASKVIDLRIINLMDGLRMTIGQNWTAAFGENEIKLSHKDGIYANLFYGQSSDFTDYKTRRDNTIKPYLNSIEAKIIQEKDILCGIEPGGSLLRTSVRVIEDRVVTNWKGLKDRDKLASDADATASELEAKATELEAKVEEMRNANSAAEEDSKKKKKDSEETTEELVTYTEEEINKAIEEATKAREEAGVKRQEATDLRKDAPTPDMAQNYQLVFIEVQWGGKQIYGYVIYKDTDYESVWESVENMLGSITMGDSNLSFR